MSVVVDEFPGSRAAIGNVHEHSEFLIELRRNNVSHGDDHVARATGGLGNDNLIWIKLHLIDIHTEKCAGKRQVGLWKQLSVIVRPQGDRSHHSANACLKIIDVSTDDRGLAEGTNRRQLTAAFSEWRETRRDGPQESL